MNALRVMKSFDKDGAPECNHLVLFCDFLLIAQDQGAYFDL